mmetsp:Transcript_22764/g.21999  ORF Transcript_22764/g.21999 Transcript_22764/m.21999 type:complete len:231 (-) Transcript_22764:303-995(-)
MFHTYSFFMALSILTSSYTYSYVSIGSIARSPAVSKFLSVVIQRTQLNMADTIVSPFDAKTGDSLDDLDDDDDDLELTEENVELVLDEMRPFLKADGGNVRLAEIDGPIVRLELVGACGTCPSSSMTMKMGLERKLKERIPEISEVVQSIPDAPIITMANIETVLDGVRPFLQVAGGNIVVKSISGVGGLQPVILLRMEGSAAALQSVKLEIMQRIQRHFMQHVRIDWDM